MIFATLLLLVGGSGPNVQAQAETRTDTGVDIRLAGHATVAGTSITLGAIASIEATQKDLGARLAALELGHSPAPGYSRYLTRAQVMSAVQRSFPGASVKLAGEAGCHIEPMVETLAAEQIELAARSEIERLLFDADAEFELDQAVRELAVPKGNTPVELRASLHDPQVRGGRLSVPVEVRVDGTTWQTVWTHWRVLIWELQPVLVRGLRRGDRLLASHFEMRRVDRAKLSDAKPLQGEHAQGAVLRRDLGAGSVVSERDIERPQVVTRGALLQLAIKSGSITARTMVHAQENGRMGQVIHVTRTDSGKELLATVRSSELVEIRLAR